MFTNGNLTDECVGEMKPPVEVSNPCPCFVDEKILQTLLAAQNAKIMDKLDTLFKMQQDLSLKLMELYDRTSLQAEKIDNYLLSQESTRAANSNSEHYKQNATSRTEFPEKTNISELLERVRSYNQKAVGECTEFLEELGNHDQKPTTRSQCTAPEDETSESSEFETAESSEDETDESFVRSLPKLGSFGSSAFKMEDPDTNSSATSDSTDRSGNPYSGVGTDVNRDEALRCIAIAKRSLLDGLREKALKFLLKAEKLHSTVQGRKLLKKLNKRNQKGTDQCSAPEDRTDAFNSDEQTANHSTSAEDALNVQRINSCKNYYEMLNISRKATTSEIRKAYKHAALLVHPDKNKAPGAGEAFQEIGKALATLIDTEKRKEYDNRLGSGKGPKYEPYDRTNFRKASEATKDDENKKPWTKHEKMISELMEDKLVKEIPGVGPKTAAKLRKVCITKASELYKEFLASRIDFPYFMKELMPWFALDDPVICEITACFEEYYEKYQERIYEWD